MADNLPLQAEIEQLLAETDRNKITLLYLDIKRKFNGTSIAWQNSTLLHYAIEQNLMDLFRVIVASDQSQLALRDHFDRTPYQLAKFHKRIEMQHSLLKLINQTDKHGCTLLHSAARNGDLQFAQSLLAAGIDKTIIDNHGKTAHAYLTTGRGKILTPDQKQIKYLFQLHTAIEQICQETADLKYATSPQSLLKKAALRDLQITLTERVDDANLSLANPRQLIQLLTDTLSKDPRIVEEKTWCSSLATHAKKLLTAIISTPTPMLSTHFKPTTKIEDSESSSEKAEQNLSVNTDKLSN